MSTDKFEKYACHLRPYYEAHSLFPPDEWPPGLTTMYFNLAMVSHDKYPVEDSLTEFERATHDGIIDDFVFKKYSIELSDILMEDSFFKEKEGQLKYKNEFYEQQLVRMLNLSVPEALKKQVGIPLDDGKGLPHMDLVKESLKEPVFKHMRLREVVLKQHPQKSVKSGAPSGAEASASATQTHVDDSHHAPDQRFGVMSVPPAHDPKQKKASTHKRLSCAKVLIDGAPGVGKTTLTWKISKDWATGELFQEFVLVVRLSLRDLPENPRSIHEILPLGSDSQRKAIETDLLETSGHKVLFIFDGWDELSPLQRDKKSPLYRMIKGELLPLSTIIITSRPYTSRSLQLPRLVPRHIELCGFTQNQIKSCINNEFSSADADKLIQLLNARTDILRLCYIPNNLSIVMHIFRTSKKTLPSTLTALYDLHIHSAKVRYVQNQYSDPEAALGLEDESQFHPKVKELLSSVCAVALNGLQNNKFVFKEKEIKDINPLLAEGANTLGLMTAYKSFAQTAIVKSFQFIHGTIQEFLASKALLKLPAKVQQEFVLNNINSTRFRVMLTFIAGQAPTSLLANFLRVPQSYGSSLCIDRLLLLLHMVYEAQSPELCKVFAQSFPNGSLMLSHLINMDMHTISDFDVHMLQYILHHSSIHWKTIESHEVPIEKLLSPLMQSQTDLCVQEVHVNPFSSEDVYKSLAKAPFEQLKAIELTLKFPLGETASSALASLSNLSHLRLKCHSQTSLESAMRTASECRYLQYLCIGVVKTAEVAIPLSLTLPIPRKRADSFSLRCEGLKMTSKFIQSLCYELDVSHNIKQLSFDECSFTSEQLCHIFTSVKSSNGMHTFHLNGAYSLNQEWTLSAITALKEMIANSTSMTELTLSHCSLDAPTAIAIAEALKENHKLVSLNLAHNQKSGRIDAILSSIQAACVSVPSLGFMQVLSLSECRLKEHIKLLANILSSKNCLVKDLDISYNGIAEEGGNAVFGALASNLTLQVLNMKGNPLWLKEGTVLNKMIIENAVLKELYLENCGLHIPAIAGLADGISRNSTLTALSLGVSLKRTPMEGACCVAAALGNNRSIQKLSLSAYVLEDEGTEALAKALNQNTTLVSLHLYRCKFGSPNSLSLLKDALYSHKSLQELALPSIDKVLQQVFSHYDRINCHRAMNKLPYLQLNESGTGLAQTNVKRMLI